MNKIYSLFLLFSIIITPAMHAWGDYNYSSSTTTKSGRNLTMNSAGKPIMGSSGMMSEMKVEMRGQTATSTSSGSMIVSSNPVTAISKSSIVLQSITPPFSITAVTKFCDQTGEIIQESISPGDVVVIVSTHESNDAISVRKGHLYMVNPLGLPGSSGSAPSGLVDFECMK